MATARILDSDHARLRELAAITGKQQQEIIHEALEAYDRNVMLDEINAGFSALKQDAASWKEEESERAAWDGTGLDGVTSE
jgi:predicted transcriptional regulator